MAILDASRIAPGELVFVVNMSGTAGHDHTFGSAVSESALTVPSQRISSDIASPMIDQVR